MATLGEVLELAHGARDRITTLRASVWHWANIERAQAAWERHRGHRTSAAAIVIRGTRAESPDAGERLADIWIEGRARTRVDRPVPSEAGEGPDVTLTQGDRRWGWIPGLGSFESTDDGEYGGFEYEWLLDPLSILAEFRLEAEGRAEVDGRPAHALRGTPRRPWRPRPLPPALVGDDYEIAIDAELGILLRMTARLDGEPFGITELRGVAAGLPLPAETFTFTPPPGREIRLAPPLRGPSGRSWCTVEEVAAAAPFTLIVPGGVSTERARGTLVGGGPASSDPRVAYLFYDLPPALDLEERAVTDAGPEPVGWDAVDVDGLQVRVRRRRARHPAGRHEACLRRDGTEVRLSSDLPVDRLLEIVASLQPARPAEQP